MGGNCSSWLTILVLDSLEGHWLTYLEPYILLYRRYVDDHFLIVRDDKAEEIFNTFNNFHKGLEFTIERDKDSKLNFLDITIHRRENNTTVLIN